MITKRIYLGCESEREWESERMWVCVSVCDCLSVCVCVHVWAKRESVMCHFKKKNADVREDIEMYFLQLLGQKWSRLCKSKKIKPPKFIHLGVSNMTFFCFVWEIFCFEIFCFRNKTKGLLRSFISKQKFCFAIGPVRSKKKNENARLILWFWMFCISRGLFLRSINCCLL